MSKKIVLTGGGTAGHVTPNIAMIPELQKQGYDVSYIGSYDGIEKTLISELGIPYTGISSGKLRRYLSVQNLTDPFRVVRGFGEALGALKSIRPDVIFSKGGFVAVPVVLAAKQLKIPCVIHESDMTPGLANKICIPSAAYVCANFPETLASLPKEKAVLTGTPIRRELYMGNREKGLAFCGFHDRKPVLMVVGGSLGAMTVNQAIREILPELLKAFQVVHLCGKGKSDPSYEGTEGYIQFEYVDKEMRDLFAASDLIVSRAGANAICEILALKIPNILIPLPADASRGDQILNAESFEKQGFSKMLREETMTKESILETIREVYADREKYREAMLASRQTDAIPVILDLLEKCRIKT